MFLQTQNPTNGLDASTQNTDQVQLRKTAAVFNGHHLKNKFKKVKLYYLI